MTLTSMDAARVPRYLAKAFPFTSGGNVAAGLVGAGERSPLVVGIELSLGDVFSGVARRAK